MKKRSFTQKLEQFLSGKGFYIALGFCVLVIAVSCWYLWYEFTAEQELAEETVSSQTVTAETEEAEESAAYSVQTDPADTEPIQTEEDAPADASSEDTLAETEISIEPEETETAAAAEIPAAEETAEPVLETETAAETSWVWPLEGEVVAAFSSETLSYNEALGDWRTHDGVDLSAELGQTVAACCDGTVLSAEEDALLGWTVTLDCGDGLTVQYSNLAEEIPVSIGDSVTAGETIGTVGESAAGESHSTPWLHLSVFRDGEAADPSEFFS